MTEQRDETQPVRHLISTHPFARGLTGSDVDLLADLGEARDYHTGEMIFEAGGTADTFFLVRTGVVMLRLPQGDKTGPARLVQRITEGSSLGWSWLFEPYTWQFDALAETPVRTVSLDAIRLRERLASDTACGFRIVMRVAEVMAERLHATRRGMQVD